MFTGRILVPGMIAALSAVLASAASTAFPSVSDLPAIQSLPDPLVVLDGTPVRSKRDWVKQRRPELMALFQHYMYGAIPPKPAKTEFTVDAVHRGFLGGKAVLKLVTISFGEPDAPKINLLLVVPNARKGRVPVFLGMNFCGNHALDPDPRIPITRGWVYSSCQGCQEGRATEVGRGSQAGDWAIEQTVDRGYAFAAFCSSDVDSDRADVSDGVYAWLARKNRTPNPPHHRGSIAAWAWGFHRCVDYLVTDRDLDPKRIAAVGHSRNGKTTLLAAAFDERVALAIPLQAGCGGTAPSRGLIGESVKQINDRFPHWFNGEFKQFNDDPSRLPFDQNCLIALMAPRPVLLANAEEDQWANPNGQFEVLKAAEPIYRLLNAGGLDAPAMPENGRLVSSKLGYFIRAGKHSMTRQDWKAFLDFADANLGKR